MDSVKNIKNKIESKYDTLKGKINETLVKPKPKEFKDTAHKAKTVTVAESTSLFSKTCSVKDSTIRDIVDNVKDYHPIIFSITVDGVGDDTTQAKLDAQRKIMRSVYAKYKLLHNPLVDTILQNLAGVIIRLTNSPDDYFCHEKKHKWYCSVNKAYVNIPAILAIAKQIDILFNSISVFYPNPDVINSDPNTKFIINKNDRSLYFTANNELYAQCRQSKYKLLKTIEPRNIQPCFLQKSRYFNPCVDTVKDIATGAIYYDYISCLKLDYESAIELIFGIDSITFRELPKTAYEVTFTLSCNNMNTKFNLFKANFVETITTENDPQSAVEAAIKVVFKSNIDKMMYEIANSYCSFILDGAPFVIRICDNCIDDDKFYTFNQDIKDCKYFSNVEPSTLQSKGAYIGHFINGNTYLGNRTDLLQVLRQFMQKNGMTDCEVENFGADILIRKKLQ